MLFIAILIFITILFVSVNILLVSDNTSSGKQYKVEISRISREISINGLENLNLEGYPSIVAVTQIDESNDNFSSNYPYEIRQIDGNLYRFDYKHESNSNRNLFIINVSLCMMAAIIIAVCIYIRQRILKQFNAISNMPFELSKGNLTIPIKEHKGKYFGKFVWGIDILREHLEQQKAKELQLLKEKKTLVLSVSHDIKTPLGVIELYAKALEKNLYKDEQKKKEVARNISEKCNEIKQYVSEIIDASSNDFLDFEIDVQEVYLSEIINEIKKLYTEKLRILKIEFLIESFIDCIIYADKDRAVEVLQNIIENAIKYGDGKKIIINFEQEDDGMLVSVTNSGCTLSSNELPHIFESFWRGSNVGTNNGSGLGLYICKKLMQAMDGEAFAKCYNEDMCVTAVFRMV